MSDERKKAKSKKVTDERRDEVAARLGFKPEEVAVFTNPDGEYAVVKDGHRLLLQDKGAVAWYGDKAPNPTYPLVVPTVEVDESDVDEIEGPVEVTEVETPPADVPVIDPAAAAPPEQPAPPAKPTPPVKATPPKK